MLKKLIGVLLVCLLSSYSQADPSYYFRSFWSPVYHKYPLSWCLSDGSHCGREPAKRYCKAMGYERLDNYRQAEELAQTSGAIDYKHLCKSGYCKTYMVIVCKNRFMKFHPRGK